MYTEEGRELSYQNITEQLQKPNLDINESDLVAIECDNSVVTLLQYLELLSRSIPILLVDRNLSYELRCKLYAHYHVSYVLSNGDGTRRLTQGPATHPELRVLLSTSGSTGSPKLVRLTEKNLFSNATQIADYLSLGLTSRAITTLPLHYSFGLSIVNSHLYAGGSIVLTNSSVTERHFWGLFNSSRANSLSGVPATFEMLKRLRFERMNLPYLRTVTQAGGRLSPELVRFFANLGKEKDFDFYVMYGQTEATARMSYLPPEEAITRSDSVGKAIPKGSFELIDQHGNEITTPRTLGELVYRGPNVMMGYATSAADLQLGDELRGVLRTGDIAERDDEGFYYIRGRLKRFIKLFGNRVNLDDVEQKLQTLGHDVYASGVDDKLVIFGLSEENAQRAAKCFCELFRFHSSAVSTYTVSNFPRNESGKLQYSKLMDMYEKKAVNNQ